MEDQQPDKPDTPPRARVCAYCGTTRASPSGRSCANCGAPRAIWSVATQPIVLEPTILHR